MLEGAGGIAAVIARAVMFGAVAVAVGAVAFRLLVVSRAGLREPERTRVAEGTAMGGAVACAVVALVALVRLFLQASEFVEDGAPMGPVVANVLQTSWGAAWMLQVGCAALAAITFGLCLKNPRPWWMVTALLVVTLALTPALGGHAIAAEQWRLMSVSADWLHVLGAGGWIGGLTLLTAFAIVLRRGAAAREAAAALVRAFHRVALGSATLLLVAGVMTLSFRVAHFVELFGSRYGTVFFVKVGLVAVVASFGAYHSRNGARRAADGGEWGLVNSLMTECAAAALVIGATAVLAGSAAPGE